MEFGSGYLEFGLRLGIDWLESEIRFEVCGSVWSHYVVWHYNTISRSSRWEDIDSA